jgi:phage shock protein PspC (stress-responsive transcriptional regulator)
MNKVVTIHLNGTAYQLEEAGYEALRNYLDAAARSLANNPDKDEIVADIEQAIGEKCRARLSGYRTVVLTKDVEAIIAEMGPVNDGSAPSDENKQAAAGSARQTGAPPPPPPAADSSGVKRLYRIHDGAMIGGVCNGIAAYFGLDPTLIRAAVALVAVLSLFVSFIPFFAIVLAYLALMLLIPAATTDAEKAAAQGIPATAQEFIRRARTGYYEAAKTFGNKDAHRAWKRRFRRDMRGWQRNFQHEMQAQARHWQESWQGWAQHPGAHRGLWFTVGLLSLIGGLVTLFWILALFSLAVHHTVFGLAVPASMPLWVAFATLCVVYGAMMAPLRGASDALRRHGWGGAPCGAGIFGLFDALIGFAFLALGIWLIDRYVPGAHAVLVKIPPALHDALAAFQHGWASR